MADVDEIRQLRREIAEVRARVDSYAPPRPAAKAKASELEQMVDAVNERRQERLAREVGGREARYQRETERGAAPAATYVPRTRAMREPTRLTMPTPPAPSAQQTWPTMPIRPAGGGVGQRAPVRAGGPVNEFMEQSVYPAFDRFGQQTPFWSPLMNIGETGLGEDYWSYVDLWNQIMGSPRATRDRILAQLRAALR